MREDQRAAGAMRPVAFHTNFTANAAGSVLASFGGTRVLCTASMEERIPPWLAGSGRGWVTAEYAMLPGSSDSRVPRDHIRKGRALEISRLIGRSIRAVCDLEVLGERQFTLDCDVLQADGGTRTAAVTGAYVALHLACGRLVDEGLIPANPLRDACAAVSVGIVDGEPMLDLCYTEDAAADADMNVAMAERGGLIEVQASAEGRPFSRTEFDALLDLAESGIAGLFDAQREALGR